MNELIQNSWLLILGSWVVLSMLAGLVIWVLLKIYHHFYPHSAPEARYQSALVGVISLFFMTLLLTYFWSSSAIFPASHGSTNEGMMLQLNPDDLNDFLKEAPPEEGYFRATNVGSRIAIIQSFLGVFWILGVVIYSFKFLGGFVYLRHLVKQGSADIAPLWLEKTEELKSRLQIKVKVQLLLSSRVKSPLTFGFLKPVIFFPIGFFTTLPANQIEAIILHELYHIKHKDYVVNIVVMCFQIIFFYHPLMWKFTDILQNERENRCDDEVIKQINNRFTYAKALLSVEQFGPRAGQVGLHFSKEPSQLNSRIMRIFDKTPSTSGSVKPFLGLLVFVFFLMSFTWINFEDRRFGEAPTIEEDAFPKENRVDNLLNRPSSAGLQESKSVTDLPTLFEQIQVLYPQTGLNKLVDPVIFINGRKVNKFANIHELIDVEKNKTVCAYLPAAVPEEYSSYAQSGVVLIENEDMGADLIAVASKPEEPVYQTTEKIQKDRSITELMPQLNRKGANILKKSPDLAQEFSLKSFNIFSNPDSILLVVDEEVLGLGLSLLEDLSPDDIEKINVLKGERAVEKYGKRASMGAIEITTKTTTLKFNNESKGVIHGEFILDLAPSENGKEDMKPYLILDGQPLEESEVKKINPNNIQHINVLKGERAIEKYGKKAQHGAVEISTKKE